MTPIPARIGLGAGTPAARRPRRPGPVSVLLAGLFLAGIPAGPARAGDEPFTYPSNYGVTGLLETPTARVMKENRFRLGFTQVKPHQFYYGTVGLFERICGVVAPIATIVPHRSWTRSSSPSTPSRIREW